uniref:Uncharacterized protein n=1 Tax=Xenopus tropicalis TaxID=8364 RepID=A0A1B8Y182_XENTR
MEEGGPRWAAREAGGPLTRRTDDTSSLSGPESRSRTMEGAASALSMPGAALTLGLELERARLDFYRPGVCQGPPSNVSQAPAGARGWSRTDVRSGTLILSGYGWGLRRLGCLWNRRLSMEG